jgi:hypothetical protein
VAKKKLPPEALDFFRKEGSRGGKKSAAAMTPEQRTNRAKRAADSMSPEARIARAKNAVAAREAKRKTARPAPKPLKKARKP